MNTLAKKNLEQLNGTGKVVVLFFNCMSMSAFLSLIITLPNVCVLWLLFKQEMQNSLKILGSRKAL